MKRKPYLHLILIAGIISVNLLGTSSESFPERSRGVAHAAEEPRLWGQADTRNVLTNYGFQNGHFNTTANPVQELNFTDQNNIGSVEKDSAIDTKEEFLTAAYFTPVDVKPSAKARIEQHLPKNKEGVLKLCNMWKLKMAELPGHRDKYATAIRLVRKLASEKMGINVSHNEVEAHYARSIENKLSGL